MQNRALLAQHAARRKPQGSLLLRILLRDAICTCHGAGVVVITFSFVAIIGLHNNNVKVQSVVETSITIQYILLCISHL